jgi:hypothetical protein
MNKGDYKLEFKIPDCSLVTGEYYCHIVFKANKIKIIDNLDFNFNFTNIKKKNILYQNTILYQNFKWKFFKNK